MNRGERSTMRYHEYLRSQLDNRVSKSIVLPKGYHVIGQVALLNLSFDDWSFAKRVGELTLSYDPRLRSVAVRMGPTSGVTRQPCYALVAGEQDTLVTHTENGVKFRVDPLRFTFSGGNRRERITLPERVADDEHVVDMFACVGQFGLHLAVRTQATVTAIEVNPEAFLFLQENIQLNDVQDRMIALLGDCREIRPSKDANRIIMGFLHDTIDYLPYALNMLSPRGGWIHLHAAIPETAMDNYCNTISTISASYGYDSVSISRKLKHYAPRIIHYVFDIELHPSQNTS